MNINNNPSTVISAGKDQAQKTRELQTDPFGVVSVSPEETFMDPVQKLRISQPQALIDTDFEYGPQLSKWENLALTNFRPYVYNNIGANLSGLTGLQMGTNSKRVTGFVDIASFGLSALPEVGTAINVQDAFLSIVNGGFVVESRNQVNGTFVYTANGVNTTNLNDMFDDLKTQIISGTVFSSAEIAQRPIMTYTGMSITVTCTGETGSLLPHGLSLGNPVSVIGVTASSNPPNGAFTVSRIMSPHTFVYTADMTPVGTLSGGTIFPNPQGNILHRPSDGGMIFSSNAASNFEQMIRQTRRYFRYQSGKGIQISSGTLLKPAIQIESMTYDSGTNLVTVQTKEKHNLLPGTTISIIGAIPEEYNVTTDAFTVTGFNTITFQPASPITYAPIAAGPYYLSINNWYGAVNRLGLFDDQNGVFFEFDGQKLYVVRRASTFQLSGKVSVRKGSCIVNQTSSVFPTIFSKQLNVGDFIVIRGMSYRVTAINSDTELVISPRYRASNSTFANVSRTVDTRVAQNDWNIDKMDGKGKSGYNLDLSKMQMFYMDYSWYGAGFIRWGFRAVDGKIIYCHKMVNNNVNTEAYMRSGNLPARYESASRPPYTYLSDSLASGTTNTMSVNSTEGFPNSGTLLISQENTIEYVNYTGKTATSFTGLTRGRTGVTSMTLTVLSNANTFTAGSFVGGNINTLQVGQRLVHPDLAENTFIVAISGNNLTLSTRSISGSATLNGVAAIPMGSTTLSTGGSGAYSWTPNLLKPVLVEFAWPTFAPTISHWGTSVIMDGGYDDDKSLLFTYGNSSSVTVAPGSELVLLGLRIAPSVDNGLSSPFGGRELINRMQLVLNSLDISSIGFTSGGGGGSTTISSRDSGVLVTIVLNGKPTSPRDWTKVPGVPASLAQIAEYGGATVSIVGGETVGGFFSQGVNSLDLTPLRELGNSVLGGGGSTTADQYYPDGPDVYHIVVRNISTVSQLVRARLSWKEAQA